MNVTDALARIGQLQAPQAVSTGTASRLAGAAAGADFAAILASVRGSSMTTPTTGLPVTPATGLAMTPATGLSMTPAPGLASLLTPALAAGGAPLSLAAALQPAALREALVVGAGPDSAAADGAATEPAAVSEPAPAGCRCESH